ncbi:MAG: translation elongation factor Ts [Proteobacteria bacterium]|nr:translation elongation factor Ts [Pseudomonadota bacterium]
MVSFNAQKVKELRDKTGCGMMECKQALVDASGDLDEAYGLLRQKGLAKVEKKQLRSTTEGTVALHVAESGHFAAVVEVNTETDFAAKNDEFLAFSAAVVCSVKPTMRSVQELENSVLQGGSGHTVKTAVGDLVGKIGENVSLRRLATFSCADDGLIIGYSHMHGKIVTLVRFSHVATELRESLRDLGKDIAMHVAALSPLYLDEKSVPSDVVQKEEEIVKGRLATESLPADKIPMIAKGRMGKFYEEVCLLKQKFVKDPKSTVADVVKELDSRVVLEEFLRFQLGEGLEKKQDNFADEVARQISASH